MPFRRKEDVHENPNDGYRTDEGCYHILQWQVGHFVLLSLCDRNVKLQGLRSLIGLKEVGPLGSDGSIHTRKKSDGKQLCADLQPVRELQFLDLDHVRAAGFVQRQTGGDDHPLALLGKLPGDHETAC